MMTLNDFASSLCLKKKREKNSRIMQWSVFGKKKKRERNCEKRNVLYAVELTLLISGQKMVRIYMTLWERWERSPYSCS